MPDHSAPVLITEPEYWAKIKRVGELLSHPLFMETVCEHIANGSSLVWLAQKLSISYSDIIKWIRSNKDRSERYNAALKDRNELVIESTLSMLQEVSQFDIRTLYDSEDRLKPIEQWSDQAARVVSSIKPGEHGTEVKLADRLKAAELIGKNKALFVDKHEVVKKISLIDLIAGSYDKEVDDGSRRNERAVNSSNGEGQTDAGPSSMESHHDRGTSEAGDGAI